ncbi:hypothetical protein ABG768_025791, partial [Culter alburnus]
MGESHPSHRPQPQAPGEGCPEESGPDSLSPRSATRRDPGPALDSGRIQTRAAGGAAKTSKSPCRAPPG